MNIEIKAPSPGESITQVLLASWLVQEGSWVERDAEIAEIESDKATLMVYAPEAGMIHFLVEAGQTIDVGFTIATIDTSAVKDSSQNQPEKKNIAPSQDVKPNNYHITPLARNIAENEGISANQLQNLKKDRITRADVFSLKYNEPKEISDITKRPSERIKMSPLRKKLAERLVSVKNETAMLTTFNEVNMHSIVEIREKYNAPFSKKYGHNIGFISFFAKAASLAFNEFPQINASIDGDDVLYYHYSDICIAVSTPKGLIAPAIRDVQNLGIAETEMKIRDFALRAKENKITLDELTGGTFTITNGGTFGSMLSTPIINPPQSAILGMHKIEDRPMAVNGKVEIHPMMYIALSYDHRLIDGKESVGFVVKVKEFLENPLTMLSGENKSIEKLLDL